MELNQEEIGRTDGIAKGVNATCRDSGRDAIDKYATG